MVDQPWAGATGSSKRRNLCPATSVPICEQVDEVMTMTTDRKPYTPREIDDIEDRMGSIDQ